MMATLNSAKYTRIGTVLNSRVGHSAEAKVAKFLDIKRSRPAMVRQHTCLAGDDKLILWGETWYREEYEFQYSTYRDK